MAQTFRLSYRPQVAKLLQSIATHYRKSGATSAEVNDFMKFLYYHASPAKNTVYDMEQALYALQDLDRLFRSRHFDPSAMDAVRYIIRHARTSSPEARKVKLDKPPYRAFRRDISTVPPAGISVNISAGLRLLEATLSNPNFLPKRLTRPYLEGLVAIANYYTMDRISAHPGLSSKGEAGSIVAMLRGKEFSLKVEDLPLPPKARKSRLERISEQLASDDPEIRKEGLQAISALPMAYNPATIFDFLIRMRSDPDAGVRAEAALGLGHFGSRKASPTLIKMLSDDNHLVRAAAAEALGMLREPRARKILSDMADTDKDPGVRRVAFRAYEAIISVSTPQKKM